MSSRARNTARAASGHITSRTLAQGLGRRKVDMITISLLIGCVIHGDVLSTELQQATYLVIAIILLKVVSTLSLWAENRITPALNRLRS
ncbi:hypothetical protein [Streptomyces sp. NPDC001380]|uniref:hypothetical protein n=1 Tax=Streptomyces sp. NPDC001380 TaxID=3364566 RepID=UPI00367A31F6